MRVDALLDSYDGLKQVHRDIAIPDGVFNSLGAAKAIQRVILDLEIEGHDLWPMSDQDRSLFYFPLNHDVQHLSYVDRYGVCRKKFIPD